MFSSRLHLINWQTDSPWVLQCLVALCYLLDPLAPVHKQKHLGLPFYKHLTHVIVHILYVHRKRFKTYYVTFETLWTSLTLKTLWKKNIHDKAYSWLNITTDPYLYVFYFIGSRSMCIASLHDKLYLWSWNTRWSSVSLDPSRPLGGTIMTGFILFQLLSIL